MIETGGSTSTIQAFAVVCSKVLNYKFLGFIPILSYLCLQLEPLYANTEDLSSS
jgi:hypothetical protein